MSEWISEEIPGLVPVPEQCSGAGTRSNLHTRRSEHLRVDVFTTN